MRSQAMQVRYTLLVFALLGAASGCRFSFDKAQMHGGFGPRRNQQVQLLVLESEDEVGKEFVAGWQSNPDVGRVMVLSVSEARDLENCSHCTSRLQPYCEKLAELGVDYFVESDSSVQYEQTFVCERYELSLSTKKPETCSSGHFDNQHTKAELRFDIIDAHRCQRVQGGSWSTVVQGEKAVSYETGQGELRRQSRLLASHFSFPKQGALSVSAEGQLVADTDFELQEGQVLAAFRGYDYLGLTRAEQGAHGLSVEPLSCCFDPRAGDVIQQRGSYHLVDITVGMSSTLSEVNGSKSLAAGLHSHLRYSSIVGGIVWGVSGDLLGRGGQRMSQGTLELGYQLKPLPGIELLAALSGGVRHVVDDGTTNSEVGGVLGAVVGMRWNPQNYWFVGGEVQLARDVGLSSTMHFVASNAPLARFYVGLELH